jgi:hypothetical protein
MKLSHSIKGFIFQMVGLIMLMAIPATSLLTHSFQVYWTLIPAAPLALLCFRESGKHYGAYFAEGIMDGIDKGLQNYFESPAFPEAIDKAWASACLSLAAEAEAVGQTDLAAGYKVLGNLPASDQKLGNVRLGANGMAVGVVGGGDYMALCQDYFLKMIGGSGQVLCQDDLLYIDYFRDGAYTDCIVWQRSKPLGDPFDFPQSGLAAALFPDAQK